MTESNTHELYADRGDKLYRRSLYTFWKRVGAAGFDGYFQCASRETCTVRRERTDTPLQALATLNDPQFVEAARNLAERAIKEGGRLEKAAARFYCATFSARPLGRKSGEIVGPC